MPLTVLLLLAVLPPASTATPIPVTRSQSWSSTGPGRDFSWPVASAGDAPEILQGFDPPQHPWLPGHRGVDLAAPIDTPIRAAAPGRVVFAGMVAGRPVVSVQHATGVRTTYEPVEPTVTAGEHVSAGEQIGSLAGAPGHCERACLHWGARMGAQHYIDPVILVHGGVQIRLYPVQG